MSSYKRPKEKIVQKEVDSETVSKLSEELSISPMLAKILVNRGLSTFESSKNFFNPHFENLVDPFEFSQMDIAVNRIIKASEAGERVTIYGDYDVDGVTATSFMLRCLKKMKFKVDYYLPDRLTEGYGLSEDAISTIAARKTGLIITVDCGITAVKVCKEAKKIGLDLIITDHHEPKEELPDAVAIVNPKVHNETYPDKNLCGAGVALKLIQAICLKSGYPDDIWKDEIDLVSIGTAADIVPFRGENRIIANFGYKQMAETVNMGLSTLMKLQGISDKAITTADVVFKLAPSINAAGRLGDPSKGIKLFLSNDPAECKVFAQELIKVNNERRAYNEKVEREAVFEALNRVELDREFAIVLGSEGWHAGVIGIAASRIVDEFCRPAFLFSIDSDGVAHGSGRSVDGCNILEALNSCSDLLTRFGGHKMAAGATLPSENIPAFRERFSKAIGDQIEMNRLVPTVTVDVEATIPQLTPKFFSILKRMEPFGPGNMRPVLYSSGLTLKKAPQTVGKSGAHLKLTLSESGQSIDAIGFGFGNRLEEIRSAKSINLAYTLTESTFRGTTSLQMQIKGIETND